MADLPESSGLTFPLVRQIENGEAQQGGALGLWNEHAVRMIERTRFLRNRIDALGLTAGSTITVGAGGDYATINAALAFLSLRRPAYVPSGFVTQIQLLAGFVMSEQVICSGVDFGWVRIVAVDAVVIIARSALTTSVLGRFPAFAGLGGSSLPTIGCLFEMSSAAVGTNRDGVFLSNSTVTILPNCGVRRAGAHGLNAGSGSIVNADSCDFREAGDACIFAQSSIVNADSATLTLAGNNGVVASRCASVSVQGATVTGAVTRGLFASVGGRINADSTNARRGGVDSATDIVVNQGSYIVSTSGTGGLNIAANTQTISGVINR